MAQIISELDIKDDKTSPLSWVKSGVTLEEVQAMHDAVQKLKQAVDQAHSRIHKERIIKSDVRPIGGD